MQLWKTHNIDKYHSDHILYLDHSQKHFDEIFIEIFNYLSFEELYQSFKGLNQRLNDLLQSLNCRAIRLWSTNEKDEMDMYNFFSSTIISLHINGYVNRNKKINVP